MLPSARLLTTDDGGDDDDGEAWPADTGAACRLWQTLPSSSIVGHMATMNISLPDDLRDFVEQRTTEHSFGSSSEYLRTLIRRDRDIRQLRSKLEAGLAGPFRPLGPEFYEGLRARAATPRG